MIINLPSPTTPGSGTILSMLADYSKQKRHNHTYSYLVSRLVRQVVSSSVNRQVSQLTRNIV